MKEYQKRVIEEMKELDKKIIKLVDFLYSDHEIDPDEKTRLRSQLSAMKDYLNVLIERIDNFEQDE